MTRRVGGGVGRIRVGRGADRVVGVDLIVVGGRGRQAHVGVAGDARCGRGDLGEVGRRGRQARGGDGGGFRRGRVAGGVRGGDVEVIGCPRGTTEPAVRGRSLSRTGKPAKADVVRGPVDLEAGGQVGADRVVRPGQVDLRGADGRAREVARGSGRGRGRHGCSVGRRRIAGGGGGGYVE